MEGKLNFVLIAIIAFLSMAVAFIVIYLVITGGNPKPANTNKENTKVEKHEEINYEKTETFAVPSMVINLKPEGEDARRILKVEVAITLEDKKFAEEFHKMEAKVKDIVRSTFSSKTAGEVENEKIEKVKEELLYKIRAMFKEPKEANKVKEILITDSYVQ